MKSVLKLRSPHIRIADQFEASASDMLAAVRKQPLEGVVGKRKDSLYEAGKRTASWIKYRVNRGQEFVIRGYIPGPHGFNSLIVGVYQDKLTPDVLDFAMQLRASDPSLRPLDLAAAIQERFAVNAHPRSIERALRRQEKKRR